MYLFKKYIYFLHAYYDWDMQKSEGVTDSEKTGHCYIFKENNQCIREKTVIQNMANEIKQ
jgi:hypothetical protein